MGNIADMPMNPTITELYYKHPAMIAEENPVQQPTAHRSLALSSPAHTQTWHKKRIRQRLTSLMMTRRLMRMILSGRM